MKRTLLRFGLLAVLIGFGVIAGNHSLPVHASVDAGTVGAGTPASCTEAAFSSALSGGGNINFDCGPNPVTITLTGQKTITADTTIDGGGVITLSGGGSTRLLNLQNGASLTLLGLSLTNGYSTGNGGAIYAERLSTLTIEDCTFANNTGYNGGVIATHGWDGIGVIVEISGSNFTNNLATAPAIPQGGNGGGAVYIRGDSTLLVSDTTFTGNQSGNGGAIHLLHGDLLATNVTFTGNAANNTAGGGGGGAVYMDGTKNLDGEVRILHSSFIHNTTNQLGGAIFSFPEGSGSTHIDYSLFDGNVSSGPGQGGAIYHQSAQYIGALEIDRSLFINNRSAAVPLDHSSSGGALWLINAPVTIRNSTFIGNDATHSQADAMAPDNWRRGFGGAIRTSDNTTIINSTLTGNTAGFVGGAIAGPALVQNTIISNNTGENPWDIQQNCTDELDNAGGNIQYPQKTTGNGNDYECLAGITAIDPLLGPLADSGGPTMTMAPMPGSPAINNGTNSVCPATDQRGYPRDDGFCDAGAYEVSASLAPILQQISPVMAGVNQTNTAFTLTVRGAEFTAECVVRWNGTAKPTTYLDDRKLTAEISASDITNPGAVIITVYDAGQNEESGSLIFTIVMDLFSLYQPAIMK